MKYIFTEDEFVTLVAISGIKSLYSFELNRKQEESAIVSSVHSLFKAGFIQELDGRMLPSCELSEILALMTGASHAVKLEFPSDTRPQRLIYLADGNEAVVLERCLSERENILKLERLPLNTLIDDVVKNEMPFYISHDEYADSELIERMRKLELYDDKSAETVCRFERVAVVSGKTEGVLNVNRTAVFARILSVSDAKSRDELYTGERLAQLLFVMLGRK